MMTCFMGIILLNPPGNLTRKVFFLTHFILEEIEAQKQ